MRAHQFVKKTMLAWTQGVGQLSITIAKFAHWRPKLTNCIVGIAGVGNGTEMEPAVTNGHNTQSNFGMEIHRNTHTHTHTDWYF